MLFIKEIDKEVERLENMIEKGYPEDALMDRIQGVLWVRNMIYKFWTTPDHDVEKYYKEDYEGD